MRKIIQISTAISSHGTVVTTSLCDDGSVWLTDDFTKSDTWLRLPDIPQESEAQDDRPLQQPFKLF